MIDALALADRIVTLAQQFDGACACAAHRQSIYDAVGMYFDTEPFHVDAAGRVHGASLCYKFGHRCYEAGGIDVHNWHMGEPMGTMINWAKRNGCWQTPGDGLAPSRGDLMFVGPRGGTHVELVTGCDGATIDTIEGGKCCRRTTDGHDGMGRQMIASRSQIWWGDRAGGDVVVGWVVCGLCPLA